MASITSCRSECSAEEAQEATGGRAIFASGTTFNDVTMDGVTIASSQCNNRFIFPGLALGAALGQTGVVTNAMINKSAEVRNSRKIPKFLKALLLHTDYLTELVLVELKIQR